MIEPVSPEPESNRDRIVARALPTGIVTFLFTDIEGSSRLWERAPDDMRDALARHDSLCREVVAHHHGVVFKTVGDAICSAFTHPNEALNAAIDAQLALSSHTWPHAIERLRVRMALHSGECTQRDGDYFGATVNRVARLSSLAYGEQILVSTATAALLRDVLSENVSLRPLGPHRLKDLAQPEPTFQVVAEGLRSDFPALPSLDARPNNLPSQISSFVGRACELKDITSSLEESRLLTIVGPGGIGKTRLGSQVAAEVLGDGYPGGAWFIDLTAVRRPDSIAGAVAAELSVRESPNEPVEKTLVAYLRERRLLLILDNSEHVLAEVAAFAKSILSKCPGVRILATSREPLHVLGERVYRLGALEDASSLFIERARAAAPSLTFGKGELEEVAALCLRLEGIPLAIELVSARLSSIPLSQLLRRLTSLLSLASKDSSEIARHRTLREMVRWSYEMLSPSEKRMLEVMSAFRGGCTVGALEAVAIEETGVDEKLDALVDKSLIQIDTSKSEGRYRMLEVVAEYACEQFSAGDDLGTRERHAAYYASVAAGASAPYFELDDEAPNIRAALDFYLSHEPDAAVSFIENLAGYWRARGVINEARSWIGRALPLLQEGSRKHSVVLCLAATFATLQDALAESLEFSKSALAAYRAAGDRAGMAHAVFRIAEALHRQRRLDEAEPLYREALEGFTASGESRGQMLCLGNLGMLDFQRREFHRASELLDEAIRRASMLRDRRIAGDFTITLGWVALRLTDLARARTLFEEILVEKGASRDRYGECAAHHGIATVALKEAKLGEAFQEFVTTLEAARELQLADYIVRALHGIAAVRSLDGNAEGAAKLLGLADRLSSESGRDHRDGIAYEVASQLLEAKLSETENSRLRAAGQRLELADAISELQGSSR